MPCSCSCACCRSPDAAAPAADMAASAVTGAASDAAAAVGDAASCCRRRRRRRIGCRFGRQVIQLRADGSRLRAAFFMAGRAGRLVAQRTSSQPRAVFWVGNDDIVRPCTKRVRQRGLAPAAGYCCARSGERRRRGASRHGRRRRGLRRCSDIAQMAEPAADSRFQRGRIAPTPRAGRSHGCTRAAAHRNRSDGRQVWWSRSRRRSARRGGFGRR